MGRQYRRASFSSWAFWGALVVGGTLFGAYKFDWFSVGVLVPGSAHNETAKTPPASGAETATPQTPPDGQIEVAQQAPVGPQSEPPPSEFDEPGHGGGKSAPDATKARLLEQRAEGSAPKLRANPTTPSSVEPAVAGDNSSNRSVFDEEPTPPKSQHRSSPIVQTAHAVEEPAAPPTAIDPDLEAQLESIDRMVQADELLRAHRELSTIYWAKPRWRPHLRARIEKTARAIYFDPRPQFLQPYIVKENDQFAQFAKRYNVPWQYLAKLNQVDPKTIQPGQKLKVIKGPFAAIIELNGFLLTVHAYGYYVRSYPIGIGKDGATPIGKFTVLNKVTSPQYTDPENHVIDGGDPSNPLGTRWLDLGRGYGIHGTIDPDSIGKAESRGCIRLRNEDVEEVYDMLGVGSEVSIRR